MTSSKRAPLVVKDPVIDGVSIMIRVASSDGLAGASVKAAVALTSAVAEGKSDCVCA